MKWHTRDILLDQQKDVEIIGPVEGMDKIVVNESDLYWSKTRAQESYLEKENGDGDVEQERMMMRKNPERYY